MTNTETVPSGSSPAIETRGLCKTFNKDTRAVQSLDLVVPRGATWTQLCELVVVFDDQQADVVGVFGVHGPISSQSASEPRYSTLRHKNLLFAHGIFAAGARR
jgi:hypothetical protein